VGAVAQLLQPHYRYFSPSEYVLGVLNGDPEADVLEGRRKRLGPVDTRQ
jgi:hypothetical protein